jgi:hypoxanthine phosphoribosyltransferase
VTDQTRQATPAFAHASEAEMARILDFYGIAWEYEPHTFPILWNLDGDVVESFSPDFYLAELDLYLEMTTLRQKLVRKKNRKLRRLRELYPDVRIKLFYARDFRALMLKYGKLALADALTGTAGQASPPDDLVSEEVIEPQPAAVPVVEADRGGELATTATMRRTASRRRRRRRAAAATGTPSTHPDRPGND